MLEIKKLPSAQNRHKIALNFHWGKKRYIREKGKEELSQLFLIDTFRFRATDMNTYSFSFSLALGRTAKIVMKSIITTESQWMKRDILRIQPVAIFDRV